MPPESIQEIALDEARRSLTQQQEVLGSIQTRATAVYTGATVATAFIAGQALPDHVGLPGLATAAFVLYFVVMCLCFSTLLPGEYEFRFDAKAILQDYNAYKPEEAAAFLAGHMEDQYTSNERKIDWRLKALSVSIPVVLIEVALWVLLLAD